MRTDGSLAREKFELYARESGHNDVGQRRFQITISNIRVDRK